MRQSHLFTKTLRDAPKGEDAVNAKLLIRGGYIHKTMAGAYAYLPLGLRVIQKISNIVREEMNAIGGQELLMTALQPKTVWDETGRWDEEVMYRLQDAHGGETGLGFSHEEALTDAVRAHVQSYKQLPFYTYQIQTKFRNEARAKSGILRGREFLMKDLYSFHTNEDDLNAYYETVADAYRKVFERCGFETVYYTEASGGSMSHLPSHEFQVPIEAGEDTVLACDACLYAYNEEVWAEKSVSEGLSCPECGKAELTQVTTSEVGNIFRQLLKYSEPMKALFASEEGGDKPIVMGAYGLGISRLMGIAVEDSHDEDGIIWNEALAPFRVHLIALADKQGVVAEKADTLYEALQQAGIEVLYDDRDARPGEKLADADLLGMPIRVVVGSRSLEQGGVEVKRRSEVEGLVVSLDQVVAQLS